MKVTLSDGAKMNIWFGYGKQRTDGRTSDLTMVSARFNDGDPDDPLYIFSVTRHYLDAPNRPASRRAALGKFLSRGATRLVTVAGTTQYTTDRVFSREDRRLIWNEYFKQHADLRRGR